MDELTLPSRPVSGARSKAEKGKRKAGREGEDGGKTGRKGQTEGKSVCACTRGRDAGGRAGKCDTGAEDQES